MLLQNQILLPTPFKLLHPTWLKMWLQLWQALPKMSVLFWVESEHLLDQTMWMLRPSPNQRKVSVKLNPMLNFKIGTWNLCLGLPNKKDIVTDYLKMNNVSLCCLQETEVQADFSDAVLNTGWYNLELELNDGKRRAGIYILQLWKWEDRINHSNLKKISQNLWMRLQYILINCHQSDALLLIN